MSESAEAFISRARTRVDEELAGLVVHTEPERLYKPVRHVLEAPGKRFRALLTMAAGHAFDADPGIALRIAVAMEVFHTFTLVHDDIMDRSPERRGRPTVHEIWDEPTAILCGDYLVGLSFDQLLCLPAEKLPMAMRRFTQAIRILCEGQIRDMEFEIRTDVQLEEYLHMIEQKTSALLQTSLVLGGLSGQAKEQDLVTLDAVGFHLGQAFQIQDDLLDLIAHDTRWGKPIGGDLIQGKKTFLLLYAVAHTEGDMQQWFRQIVLEGMPAGSVEEARMRMEQAGVLEAARSEVIFHSVEARRHLKAIPPGLGRDALELLADRMQKRVY